MLLRHRRRIRDMVAVAVRQQNVFNLLRQFVALRILRVSVINGSIRMLVPPGVCTRTVACPSHVMRVPFNEAMIPPVWLILLSGIVYLACNQNFRDTVFSEKLLESRPT